MHDQTMPSSFIGRCEASEAAQFIPADLRNWEVLLVLASKELGAIQNVF